MSKATDADIREWARLNGVRVAPTGRLAKSVREAYAAANRPNRTTAKAAVSTPVEPSVESVVDQPREQGSRVNGGTAVADRPARQVALGERVEPVLSVDLDTLRHVATALDSIAEVSVAACTVKSMTIAGSVADGEEFTATFDGNKWAVQVGQLTIGT